MRSGKKRNRKPKFQGDWGTSAVDRGERGMKRDKKKFNFFHRT
jgi:hypothetical protein